MWCIEGCGWAFLVAAAVLVCVSEKTQNGSPYAAEPPQAARPNRLTAVYLQCESRQFQRASGRQGLNRRRLASPIQHTPPVLSFGGFSTPRAGRQRRASRRLCGSRRYSLARLSSSGVTGCENKET